MYMNINYYKSALSQIIHIPNFLEFSVSTLKIIIWKTGILLIQFGNTIKFI